MSLVCIICMRNVPEVCRDDVCRDCHVGITWEVCNSGEFPFPHSQHVSNLADSTMESTVFTNCTFSGTYDPVSIGYSTAPEVPPDERQAMYDSGRNDGRMDAIKILEDAIHTRYNHNPVRRTALWRIVHEIRKLDGYYFNFGHKMINAPTLLPEKSRPPRRMDKCITQK